MEQQTGLIIIDIQKNYFKGGTLELFEPERAALKAKEVLEYFRNHNMPVFHVKHLFKLDMEEERKQELLEFHNYVAPIDGEVVFEKHYPSAFLKTNLHSQIAKANVKKLIIVGMMSHMCIDTTTRAAQDYGYEVIVLEDACTTKDLMTNNGIVTASIVHDIFMASLDGTFGSVMTVDHFING